MVSKSCKIMNKDSVEITEVEVEVILEGLRLLRDTTKMTITKAYAKILIRLLEKQLNNEAHYSEFVVRSNE